MFLIAYSVRNTCNQSKQRLIKNLLIVHINFSGRLALAALTLIGLTQNHSTILKLLNNAD